MLAPYRAIFAAPGTKGFSAAGFLARMPMGMYGVAMVTMLSELRGSFALAGSVMATTLVSVAILGPRISRLVDRFGQMRVMAPTVALSVVANVGLLLSAHYDAPGWMLFVWSAMAGCTPNVGAMVRARWAVLYRDEPRTLHTAYSFESMLDEVCYIVGPILAVGLSSAWFPGAGLLLATLLLATGSALLAPQRSTEPPVHTPIRTDGEPAKRDAGLMILVLALIACGVACSAIQVTTIAFAEQQGKKAAASVVLAISALGSCTAAIVSGLVRPRRAPERRVLIALMLFAASTLLLPLPDSLLTLSVALFVVGMTTAPVVISSMALVERLVPASELTEGLTWANTGLVVGVAAGSWIAGWVVDHSDARTAFWVPSVSGALGLATMMLGWRWLSGRSSRGDALLQPTTP